jgi:methylmalonyl-CoA/ethylmalonyl-CoA epimerase
MARPGPPAAAEAAMSDSPSLPAITGIGQIAVNARDVARATAFYREVVGLRFLFEAPGLAFFDCGGVRLMISKPSSPQFEHPASILYYRVADIRASHAALEQAGVTVEGAPHEVAKLPDHDLWIGFYRDTEDNVFALMSEVRR